ncbi:TetR/AcrR family transcriptional regulator, partial [Dietzia sp. SLG310A2-38A2]|nr:TetR/AcrR family transcriptional regulator [Dietzia sp. SLG310A2-38A2]
GGQRGELLERLTELTHREVIAMRQSGAASRVRADA